MKKKVEYFQKNHRQKSSKFCFFFFFSSLKVERKKEKILLPKGRKQGKRFGNTRFSCFSLFLFFSFSFSSWREEKERIFYFPLSLFFFSFFFLRGNLLKKEEEREMKKEKRPCFKTNKVFIYLYYIFYPSKARIKICASLRLNDICENMGIIPTRS